MKKYTLTLMLCLASAMSHGTPIAAACDGVTNDLTTINNAIAAASTAGGDTLELPAGTCVVSAGVTMKPDVHLTGTGPTSTILLVSGTGDGIKMGSTINSSTYVNTSVEHLQIKNTNGSNTGGGYVDVAGTFVNLNDVKITGFKFGIILDQSELVSMRRVYFDSQLSAGAGLWLVNGPDHTASAIGEFTNRVTLQESTFSQTAVCVADDGGIAHSFSNNNFEGCSTPFRLADQISFDASNNEFENATASIFHTVTTSFTGLSVPTSQSITVRNNQASIPLTFNLVDVDAAVKELTVENNVSSNSLAAVVDLGTSLVTDFKQTGNRNQSSTSMVAGTSTTEMSLSGGFYDFKDLLIENQVVMSGGNLRFVNGFGSDAITWTTAGTHGNINISTNSATRLSVSDTGIDVTGTAKSNGNTLPEQTTGSWTPTDQSGAGLTFTQAAGTYVKTGKQVFISARVTYPSTANTSLAVISAPFVSGVSGHPEYCSTGVVVSAGSATKIQIDRGSSLLYLYSSGNVGAMNAGQSGQVVDFSLVYQTP